MRKILYISGTRADYGLMRETLISIAKHPELKIEIVVTGMHLMPEFGRTIDEIKGDRLKIHIVKSVYRNDNRESMVNFIGELILKLQHAVKKIRPDVILVLGDRAEMLAGAVVGAYLAIPVVHIHGGDVSSTVDEVVRHAITKLSHIHLAATKSSAERIRKMGEDPWRVNVVGAPGLDAILKSKLLSRKELEEKYRLDLTKPVILVTQHPVSSEIKDSARQMKETMEALKELKYQSIVIYPNADLGSIKMIGVIKQYRKYLFIKVHKNIPYTDYLSLMKEASVMVGNSSAGIIEAPSFNLPVVNIGSRQNGRERGSNIIDTDYKKDHIKTMIKKALYDRAFGARVKRGKTPYGDGRASLKIVRILKRLQPNKKLLEKRIAY